VYYAKMQHDGPLLFRELSIQGCRMSNRSNILEGFLHILMFSRFKTIRVYILAVISL
jgi:hypothetical protein